MRGTHTEKFQRSDWYIRQSVDVSSQFTIRRLHGSSSEGAGRPGPCFTASVAPAVLGQAPVPAAPPPAEKWGRKKLLLTGLVTFMVMLAIFFVLIKISKL